MTETGTFSYSELQRKDEKSRRLCENTFWTNETHKIRSQLLSVDPQPSPPLLDNLPALPFLSRQHPTHQSHEKRKRRQRSDAKEKGGLGPAEQGRVAVDPVGLCRRCRDGSAAASGCANTRVRPDLLPGQYAGLDARVPAVQPNVRPGEPNTFPTVLLGCVRRAQGGAQTPTPVMGTATATTTTATPTEAPPSSRIPSIARASALCC